MAVSNMLKRITPVQALKAILKRSEGRLYNTDQLTGAFDTLARAAIKNFCKSKRKRVDAHMDNLAERAEQAMETPHGA